MKIANMSERLGRPILARSWIEKIEAWIFYLAGLYIFLNPFPATSPKEIIFYTMILLAVIVSLYKKAAFSFATPLRNTFGLFIIWSFIGLFFALDTAASVNDFFFHLIKLVFLYFIIINFYDTRKKLEILSWLIILSGTIFALVLFTHWYLILGNPLSTRLGLTYKDYATSINGYLTVFALICTMRQFSVEKRLTTRLGLGLCLLLLLAVSLLSQGRATILGLLVAISIMNLKKIKRGLLFGFILVALVMVTPVRERFTSEAEYHARIGQILYTYEIIKDFPVFGIGYSVDTFRDDTRIDREKYMARLPAKYQKASHPYLWPHNMFLSIAVRTGVPGGIIFLAFLTVPIMMCWKLIYRTEDPETYSWGLCGLAVLVMFIIKGSLEPIFVSFVENIFCSILAIATIAWRLFYFDNSAGQADRDAGST